MRRFLLALMLAAILPTTLAAEENRGSANYMLPSCKVWLKIAVDRDAEAIKSILRTEPIQLTTAGMCAGTVIGIVETLRMFQLTCPPDGVTNDQLVRMVVNQIEKHPESSHEDFIVPASTVFLATWPCRK